ncbi:MAG: nadD [Polaromonas sp.]|nr:nadD [Polaromonas sp.]
MSPAGALPHGRRIGVFGGAFDPPHNAHLALARTALQKLALDQLLIVPTGHAWHKARTLTAPGHRLAMAKLAFSSLPGAFVDAREIERPGPTFTIDTLQALQAENPGAQLHLIMGADQFAAFRQWHRWQAIVDIAIICIADRAVSAGARAGFDAYSGYQDRFLSLPMPLMPVSATEIRQTLATNPGYAERLSGTLSPAVARYISSHRLYSSV